MRKSAAIRLVRRVPSKLNEPLIEELASAVCASGDDPRRRAEALLLLMDEIQHSENVEAIAMVGKQVAFARLAEENSELMEAQIQLLRSEF